MTEENCKVVIISAFDSAREVRRMNQSRSTAVIPG